MWTKMRWGVAVAILLLCAGPAQASGPCGIYARVDEVTLGPDAENPGWVLLKGDFLLATTSRVHIGPARGYVCFALPAAADGRAAKKNRERALIEYEDMKELLKDGGKGKIYIAFGSAFSEGLGYVGIEENAEKAKLEQSRYPVQHGLTKLRAPVGQQPTRTGAEQNPVLVLQEFQIAQDKVDAQKKDGKTP